MKQEVSFSRFIHRPILIFLLSHLSCSALSLSLSVKAFIRVPVWYYSKHRKPQNLDEVVRLFYECEGREFPDTIPHPQDGQVKVFVAAASLDAHHEAVVYRPSVLLLSTEDSSQRQPLAGVPSVLPDGEFGETLDDAVLGVRDRIVGQGPRLARPVSGRTCYEDGHEQRKQEGNERASCHCCSGAEDAVEEMKEEIGVRNPFYPAEIYRLCRVEEDRSI